MKGHVICFWRPLPTTLYQSIERVEVEKVVLLYEREWSSSSQRANLFMQDEDIEYFSVPIRNVSSFFRFNTVPEKYQFSVAKIQIIRSCFFL